MGFIILFGRGMLTDNYDLLRELKQVAKRHGVKIQGTITKDKEKVGLDIREGRSEIYTSTESLTIMGPIYDP